MRFQFVAVFALCVLVSYVHCGCDKSSEDSDEGDVTHFFKGLGCDIKKGAEKISDTAKPWVDEIGKTAKKFGGTVADTFSDLKDKITGNEETNTTAQVSSTTESSSSSSAQPTVVTPSSIDDRILLDVLVKCPDGKQDDGRGHCRSIA